MTRERPVPLKERLVDELCAGWGDVEGPDHARAMIARHEGLIKKLYAERRSDEKIAQEIILREFPEEEEEFEEEGLGAARCTCGNLGRARRRPWR